MPKVKIKLPYRHGVITPEYRFGKFYAPGTEFDGSVKECEAIVASGRGTYIDEPKPKVKPKAKPKKKETTNGKPKKIETKNGK